MGFCVPPRAFWGLLFLLPLVLEAGGEWFFFRPPALVFDPGLLITGNSPGGDDDDTDSGSSLVLAEPEDDALSSVNERVVFSDDDDHLTVFNDEALTEEAIAIELAPLRLIPVFPEVLTRENLLETLGRYLWLGLDWSEEDLDVRCPEAFEHLYPYLRLYHYEPRGPARIDPEFLYRLIERDGIITRSLGEGERLNYLFVRAEWMDSFMSPEDALHAWGVLALERAQSWEVRLLLRRILATPYSESSWRSLGRLMGRVKGNLLRYAVTRLMYAKFRLLYRHSRFSVCMPWLLVLPGLTSEERESVRDYLQLLIYKREEAHSSSLVKVYAAFLDIARDGQNPELLLSFAEALFKAGSSKRNVCSYFFYVRCFCMLSSDTDRELLLLNKIVLLLTGKDENAIARSICVFEGLAALLNEGILSEKAHQFCLEILCTPLLSFPHLEPQRIAADRDGLGGGSFGCRNL